MPHFYPCEISVNFRGELLLMIVFPTFIPGCELKRLFVEDVQMDLSGMHHPVDHGVCLEVHTTVFVAAGLLVQRNMIIELPVDDGSDQRSGGNAVTEEIR